MFMACSVLVFFSTIASISTASAQTVLFDFDGATIHSPFPIDQTAGGITAHLAATGQGCSIQEANVLGFTPQGFAGLIIYPNSINLADLLIRFDQTLTDFSIMYCCQELGCDDAATMRMTAFMNGSLVGTGTKTASHPGTWPVDTLGCSFPLGFDSVVVHYDSRPPTCQDYGTIFMADNMRVTALGPAGIHDDVGSLPRKFTLLQNYPNPFNPATTIRYALPQNAHVTVSVFNMLGERVALLVDAQQQAGFHDVMFHGDGLSSGVYVYRMQSGSAAGSFMDVKKLLLMK